MVVGSVVSLWRYPVKSMMGEELNASLLTERGLFGDRIYAIMDTATGKVASAKHPRKWKKLFDCHAAFVEPPRRSEATVPPVWITLPDGTVVRSEQKDINEVLSNLLEREVELRMPAPATVSLEEYWPDIEGLTHRETVTDEAMPPETFFDLSPIHVLTTSTIDRLRELYPKGRFEVRRFRPNIVVEPDAEGDFIDDTWIGHSLTIGDEVRLAVTGPCPRCVMITLPQGDLPSDPGILRTAAQHNQANIGIYASVLSNGTIHRGDPISLD